MRKMAKMKRVLSLVLASALTFSALPGPVVQALEMGTKPADDQTTGQPFNSMTGGSQLFRIPGLVSLDNGTIVACCDARWTTGMDGGGLDTIVSRSTNYGETWNYTFANYFGDNGNRPNGASTAFIDPAIATDGNTVYMIADLFPAGYALNGANNSPLTGKSSENGNMLLSNDDRNNYEYYLEKQADSSYIIKDKTTGNPVAEYTVDAYFNIKGVDETTSDVNTNLFFENSPFKPFPTDYLYFTKSTDGGAHWSAPTIIHNVKRDTEQTLLVGPGNGLVTSDGRLIFTVYEHSGTTERSAVIYSKDWGETWERGESIKEQTSEATVTEVDGKLYMFTRYGGYYVSDNWGETWSSKITPSISYYTGCQLSVITYSKKIDGKTAILLSVPSGPNRKNGKIFVGLVQEDGKISWDYNYSINSGGAHYAYSCLDELDDGNIGLLYESAYAQITYKKIEMSDIAKNAELTYFWCEDGQQKSVKSCSLKPNNSITLNIKSKKSGQTYDAVSSNEEIVTAEVQGNALTIKAANSVDGLAQADITVKDETGDTLTIHVNVTSEDKYEIVKLRMGDTKKFTDRTGNYQGNPVPDQNVVDLSMAGEDGAGNKLQAQLATGVGSFGENTMNVSDCEYTFVSKGEDNYEISATTSDGTKVYLHQREGNNVPNKTATSTIAVKSVGNGLFTFQDLGTGTYGAYLYFWRDNSKLYFDRNGSVVDACKFELYQASDAAPDNSPIKGYLKVDAVQDGEKYLIAANVGNDYYLLRPSKGANYDHAAKVTTEFSPNQSFTDITFTGASEGETTIKIGDTTYYIFVKNDVKDIQLEVGGYYVVEGELIQDSVKPGVVSLAVNEKNPPYRPVSKVTTGEYLFGSSAHIITNEATNTNPKGLKIVSADFEGEISQEKFWKITEENGKYTIQDANGKYLTITGNNVEVSDTKQLLEIKTRGGSEGNFEIKGESTYLNNFNGSNSQLSAWPNSDNDWKFYQPMDGYVITALKDGRTKVVIGGTTYNITVGDGGINTDELQTLVNQADAMDESLYTPESWSTLKNELDNAKAVLLDEEATQDVIDGAVAKLDAAIKGVVRKYADVTALKKAYDDAIANVPVSDRGFLTDSSRTAFEAALQKAEDLINRASEIESKDQALVDEAENELKSVVIEYKEANLDKLNAQITAADAKKTEIGDLNYLTDDSKAAFVGAYAAATALANDTTVDIRRQTEINTAADNLKKAIEGVQYKPADVSGLQTVYNNKAAEVPESDRTLLTDDSKTKFEAALQTAKELIDRASSLTAKDQDTVNAAKTALESVIITYKPADKDALNTQIAAADTKKTEIGDLNYLTDDSKTKFESAYAAATALANDTTVDIRRQTDINTAAENLKKAIESIAYKPVDVSGLRTAYNNAAAKVPESDRTLLTDDSKTKFEAALQTAKELIDGADGLTAKDQARVDAAKTTLESVIITYKAADKDALNTQIAAADTKKTEIGDLNYLTSDSKAAFENAYTAATALANDTTVDIRRQADIDAAADNLKKAIEGVVYRAVNVVDLQTAYNDAAAKVPESDRNLLTDDSKAKLEAALQTAKELIDGADSLTAKDQARVDAAKTALESVTIAYKPVNKDALNTQIAAADAKKTEIGDLNYLTDDSKAAFENAYAAATALAKDTTVDIRRQADIDAAADNLKKAIDGVEYKPVDLSALRQAYEKLSASMTEEEKGYLTEDSKKNIEDVLQKAKALLDQESTLNIKDQAKVNAMLDQVNGAKKEYKKIEKEKAEEIFKEAATVNVNFLKAEAKDRFVSAKKVVQELLERTDLTVMQQEELNTAQKVLQEAMDSLEYLPAETEKMDTAVVDADKKLEGVTVSKENQAAIDEAKAELEQLMKGDLDIRDQEAIDKAVAKLEAAVNTALAEKDSPKPDGNEANQNKDNTSTDKKDANKDNTSTDKKDTNKDSSKKDTAVPSAKTGDSTGLMVEFMLLLLSGAVIAVLYTKKKRA